MGPASRVRRLALVADLWMLTRVTQGNPISHETLKICGPSIFTFGRLEFADLLNGKQIVAIHFPSIEFFGISVPRHEDAKP
jgi:hypothetical protein